MNAIASHIVSSAHRLSILRVIDDRTSASGTEVTVALGKMGYNISPGVLYPSLAELADDGLLRGPRKEIVNGRARKVYAITQKGRRHYREAAADVDRDERSERDRARDRTGSRGRSSRDRAAALRVGLSGTCG